MAFVLLTLVTGEARAQTDTILPMLVSVETTTEISEDGIHFGNLGFRLTFSEPVTGVACDDVEAVSTQAGGTTDRDGSRAYNCDSIRAEGTDPASSMVWLAEFSQGSLGTTVYLTAVAFRLKRGATITDVATNALDSTSAVSAATDAMYGLVRNANPTPAPLGNVHVALGPSGERGTNPFTVEVLFSRLSVAMVGANFDPDNEAHLTITNGELVNFVAQEDLVRWTLTIRATERDMNGTLTDVTVTIPANVITAGGRTLTSEVSETFTLAAGAASGPSQQAVRRAAADFMQRRGAQIMAARPDFIRLLDGSGIGASNLSLNDGSNRRFAFSGSGREIAGLWGGAQSLSLEEGDRAAARGDFWVSLRGIRTESGGNEDDFYWLSIGTHRRLDANRIIGGFIAIDKMDSDIRIADAAGEGTLEGTGWLAGPYLVGRVAERGLYYEVHAAYGQSSNEFRPHGTFEDEFDTERYLLGGTLKGEYALKGGMEGWTLRPALGADWFREEQDDYSSGSGGAVRGQDIALGEVRAGPELARVVRLEGGGDLSVEVGLYGVASLEVDAGDSEPETFDDGDARGRVTLNLGYARDAATVGLGLYYGGIGQSDYEAYGIDLSVRVAF